MLYGFVGLFVVIGLLFAVAVDVVLVVIVGSSYIRLHLFGLTDCLLITLPGVCLFAVTDLWVCCLHDCLV